MFLFIVESNARGGGGGGGNMINYLQKKKKFKKCLRFIKIKKNLYSGGGHGGL